MLGTKQAEKENFIICCFWNTGHLSPLVTWSLLRIPTEALGSNAQVVGSHVESHAEDFGSDAVCIGSIARAFGSNTPMVLRLLVLC